MKLVETIIGLALASKRHDNCCANLGNRAPTSFRRQRRSPQLSVTHCRCPLLHLLYINPPPSLQNIYLHGKNFALKYLQGGRPQYLHQEPQHYPSQCRGVRARLLPRSFCRLEYLLPRTSFHKFKFKEPCAKQVGCLCTVPVFIYLSITHHTYMMYVCLTHIFE